MSSERIVQQLINFVSKNGRLPRLDEPGLEEVIREAIEEFGSLELAFSMAGLTSENREWKRKNSFSGKIRKLLDYNPMTLPELRQELNVGSDFATKINATIKQDNRIKSVGPRRGKVYFLEGQEPLAQTRLDEIMYRIPKLEEEMFYLLRNPMTKVMLAKSLFGDECSNHSKSKISRYLRELLFARLVYKTKFVVKKGRGHSRKFTNNDFFGDLADKTFYCRFDCPNEVAELVIRNVINLETGIAEIEQIMLKDKRRRKLKRMLPQHAYRIVEPYLIE